MAFEVKLTLVGQAKIAAAIAASGQVSWTHMAVGDGSGSPTTPAEGQTTLVHEVYRATINQLTLDDNVIDYVVAELVIPTSVGGWTVREIGIYDADDDLVAIANFPATYKPLLSEGSGRDLIIRLVVKVANTSAVTLLVDPTVVTASQQWVLTLTATETRRGIIELATQAEVNTGTDAVRAVTPATLAARSATETRAGIIELATQAEVNAGSDAVRAVTPATLAARAASSTLTGLIELATQAEVNAGADAVRAVTPATLAARTATDVMAGIIELATQAEVNAGADASRAVTPATLAARLSAAIAGLVNAAPGTLDTLNELAAALGNDSNFAANVSNAIASKSNIGHTHSLASVTDAQSYFGASYSFNGYQRILGGFIIQWGTVGTIGSQSAAFVTFPVAFPNACASAVATAANGGGTAQSESWINSPGNGGFTMQNMASVGRNFRWIAVGY